MIILTLITIGSIYFTILLMEKGTDFNNIEDEENYNLSKYNYWTYLCVLIYALIITIVNAFITSIAEFIVNKLNIGNDVEYEQTMTKYIFVISFLYAYSGLFVLAYEERSFSLCNMLMIYLHILQRIGLNLYEYCQPYRKLPKIFKKHSQGMKPHCRKYPDDYEQFSQRNLHLDIEQ